VYVLPPSPSSTVARDAWYLTAHPTSAPAKDRGFRPAGPARASGFQQQTMRRSRSAATATAYCGHAGWGWCGFADKGCRRASAWDPARVSLRWPSSLPKGPGRAGAGACARGAVARPGCWVRACHLVQARGVPGWGKAAGLARDRKAPLRSKRIAGASLSTVTAATCTGSGRAGSPGRRPPREGAAKRPARSAPRARPRARARALLDVSATRSAPSSQARAQADGKPSGNIVATPAAPARSAQVWHQSRSWLASVDELRRPARNCSAPSAPSHKVEGNTMVPKRLI